MQPNNQQGYYQPGQNQPAQPIQPPRPPVVTPVSAPSATPTPGIAPVVDPAALQQALNSPAPQQPVAAVPPQQPVSTPSPLPLQVAAFDQPATPETGDLDDDPDELSDEPITWMAQEYIHHEKGTLWFFLFAVVIIGLIGISIFTQAWSFTVLIVVIAIVVIVYSRRPPRELTYSLTDEGLTIDGTLHEFSHFKSFGIIRDGEEFSVMLIPTQRFQPGISVYFPEEAGEDIVDMLGSRLPMKDLKLDAVDRVVRLLRL